MPSKLDQLRLMTAVVADTGDIEAVRRLRPQDCTTNPTLILKAAGTPAGADILDRAIGWARSRTGGASALLSTVTDRVAVATGAELAALVPGRVSTEVDADLSFDTARTVSTARRIVADYEALGIGRERILIKIAATWEGIRAAEELARDGIDCNLTLVFSIEQAMACADAGAFLISPFVGRILDWHVAAGRGPFEAETDPGVLSVRQIYAAFKARGVATVVMGASFRNAGEVEALAGCDRLTVSPALLDELAGSDAPLPRRLRPDGVTDAPPWVVRDEAAFRFALNADATATEKLADGIRQFVRDLRALQDLVAARLRQAEAA